MNKILAKLLFYLIELMIISLTIYLLKYDNHFDLICMIATTIMVGIIIQIRFSFERKYNNVK